MPKTTYEHVITFILYIQSPNTDTSACSMR